MTTEVYNYARSYPCHGNDKYGHSGKIVSYQWDKGTYYYFSMAMNSMCHEYEKNSKNVREWKFPFKASQVLYRGVCLKQLFSSNPILIPPKNHSKLHQRLLPMAHNLIASLPICNSTRVLVPSKDLISLVPSRSGIPRPIQCMLTSEISDSPKIFRRSANYQPSIWHYDYIQSLFFFFFFFLIW